SATGWTRGAGSSPCRAWPQPRQDEGLQSVDERSFSGGTRARDALRWPGCPPRFREDGGAGGLRLRPIVSEEGGLYELVELSRSRAWRSRTMASNSAIRSSIAFQADRRAAWASAGMVFQTGSGIG